MRSELARRDRTMQKVASALARLHEATSSAALLDTAAAAACHLRFDRALLSRVGDSLWIPERAAVPQDQQWGDAIVDMARTQPQRLDRSVVESEMLRRRTSLLVLHAHDRTGVNRPLAEACMTRSYCAAPVVVRGVVAGFLHADNFYRGADVDSFDQHVLTLYAHGLGQALSRTIVLDEVAHVRDHLNQLSTSLAAVHAGRGRGRLWSGEAPPTSHRGESGAVMPRDTPVDSSLTPREAEILRLIATGATNAGIARRLYISEGTVKSHVKHILRKLCAATRAEAVSYWFQGRRGEG